MIADMTARHPDNHQPFVATEVEGWLCGPMRRPTNNSQHEAGTIHDDDTARDLGFRAGTIAGSIHMEQFLPLCLLAFGEAWQRTGSLSLYFLNPSIDGEAVQAKISQQEVNENGIRKRMVSMQTLTGLTVLEGSAACGGLDATSIVRQRLARSLQNPPARPRILANIPTDFQARSLPTTVPQQDIDRRLSIITEPRREFSDRSAYGRTVAPLSAAVHAMRVFESTLPVDPSAFVGMFGAIDWEYINGPVYADYTYVVNGKVLAVGESPKTETLWMECVLHDPASGLDVARMLMLSRLLKASSSRWADAMT